MLVCVAGFVAVVLVSVLGSRMEGGWFGWVVLVLLAVGFPYSAVRYHRRGPAVGWVPRRWRPRANRWYAEHGWDAPYDDAGNKKRRPWWW